MSQGDEAGGSSGGRVLDPLTSGTVRREEGPLAGWISGVLYVLGGATFVTLAWLPGVTHAHRAWVLAIAGGAVLWGAFSVWAFVGLRAPNWLVHVSLGVAFLVISAGTAVTGGADSPAWIYLFFVVVFVAYFLAPRLAGLYVAACVLTHGVVLLYDSRALHDEFLGQFLVASAAYLALGGAILAGKLFTSSLRERAERLAAEQSALRRVATAVVSGSPAHQIYELASFEAAALLDAGAAGILRFDGLDQATVMGSWADHPGGRYDAGTVVPVRPGSDVEQALLHGRPVRVQGHLPDSAVGRLGYSASIVAPVWVAERVWGALAVSAAEPARLSLEDEDRLEEFGRLLATAIASIEDRAKLAAQASSDPLTGVANHRILHGRLAGELARAERNGSKLSVAVLDIDHFKSFNDVGGHEAGDELLVSVASCLGQLARAGDVLGRVGGDEFAWILPETTREEALAAVERARQLVTATISTPYRVTLSAGICDTSVTQDAAELIRLADGALYWSKAHGRDQCWIYDSAVVAELSAQERAERLERSQALLGLRALARAIDAKDPATREHSERVSLLAGRLARQAGWSAEQALMLSEAALVHDVGKIGVPDATLRKTSTLTDAERAQIRGHAELAARIVEGVLSEEQVDWIRTHHERPDGTGYPRGLTEAEIPDGAALLAVSDAWDVMTVSRPYSSPKTVEAAMAECISLIGQQFTAPAVAALQDLYTRGELSDTPLAALLAPSGL